jgi:CRISPR-associated protein Cas1
MGRSHKNMKDLHLLPKVRDSSSFLYVEHCKIDQEGKAIAIHDANGRVPVPCASLLVLMLGPGTSITHAAVRSLADSGCTILWTGEEGVRTYAQGMGETRSSERLLHQSRLCSAPELRFVVVKRLYTMRFPEKLDPSLTIQQLRGMEGVRVRDTYFRASRETGIPWSGRSYKTDNWQAADAVNRALSVANGCLYGVCHAAIVSVGYSPALGFIHTGKMLSFVYDVADLYKTEVTIPIAFRAAAEGMGFQESHVRRKCRDAFVESRLLQRIIPDIDRALDWGSSAGGQDARLDAQPAAPGWLWDPEVGAVEGGMNRGDDAEGGDKPRS